MAGPAQPAPEPRLARRSPKGEDGTPSPEPAVNPRPDRSLTGFYIAVGAVAVLVGLGVWLWRTALGPYLAVNNALSKYGPILNAGETIAALGGPRHAAEQIGVYIKFRERYYGRRAQAVQLLGECRDERAVPQLIGLLKDEDCWVRCSAARGLGMIGPPARHAIPQLIEMYRANKSTVDSEQAICALGHMGPLDEGTIEVLVSVLKDPDSCLARASAVRSLREGAPPNQVVQVIVMSLNDRVATVRRTVLECLGELGVEAKVALPQVERSLADEDEFVRQAAANVLSLIDPSNKAAVPVLIEALTGRRPSDACEALGRIGPGAKDAIPKLEQVLTGLDTGTRTAAAAALKKIRGEEAAK